MSITREDVADLREGDVVELQFPTGSVVRGPLTSEEHYGPGLGIASAGWVVRDRYGEPGWGTTQESATLTVVSRAPRPLYVNHPRTEPVPGDVVRDADGDHPLCWDYVGGDDHPWATVGVIGWHGREETAELPARLRLLVDGELGQVVP